MFQERYRAKQLLVQQEILNPKLFVSLKAALQPLIGIRAVDSGESESKMKKQYDENKRFIFVLSNSENDDEDSD